MSDTLPPLPEPAAHMYPSDLERFQADETFAHAYSVAVGSPDERSVPLFTLSDMVKYADERAAAAVAEPGAIHQWRTIGCADWYDGHPDHGDGGGPYETRTLYAAPPQREREPLTDEQIDAVTREQWGEQLGCMKAAHRAYVRAIERAHGITKEAP